VSRIGLAAAVIAVAGVAAIGLAWLAVLRDDAEPATIEDAVASFRTETEASVDGRSAVVDGVYVYDTDGSEATDALTGVTHTYPRRSTVTLTSTGCGVRMRWDVLRGRSTEWTLCVGDDGWTLETQDERHTFFGRTERTTYACDDTSFRPLGDRPGARFRISCGTGSADERGTGRVVGRGAVRVGAERIGTVHVRKTTTFKGDIRGHATYDFWIARQTGVPVRIAMVSATTNDSAVGDVHYDERVTLVLRSSRPRR
jgi:hypothetical protein